MVEFPKKPPSEPRVGKVLGKMPNFGPVLYAGESHDDFDAYRTAMLADLRPAGAIQGLYAEDAIHYHWDVIRHRRYVMKHVAASEHEGLDALLTSMDIYNNVRQDLVTRFANADPQAVRTVTQVLAAAGHDLETVRARAIALHVDEIGRYQSLIGAAERRRDKALRELADRRDRFPEVAATDASGDD